MLRFPGLPGEYPLAPGQTAVVAAQAIDHREVHPGRGLLDLRGADFELPGSVDNPRVPNMINVGLYGMPAGWEVWLITHVAPFLARPVEVGSLERVLDVHDRYRIRFPRDLLLENVTFIHPLTYDSQFRLCPQQLPPSTTPGARPAGSTARVRLSSESSLTRVPVSLRDPDAG